MKMKYVIAVACLWTTMATAGEPPTLQHYVGIWKVETATKGCRDSIAFERGANKNSVRLKTGASFYVSEPARFPTSPDADNQIHDGSALNTTTIGKFIRGSIVSAHIWEPSDNEWLGVGIRVWRITPDGKLHKQKAGVSFELKSKRETEANSEVMSIDATQAIDSWKLECVYTR